MSVSAGDRRGKSRLLALVRSVPAGSIVTVDLLAKTLAVIPGVVVTILAHLTDDEREATPWHRVVAKGGAIGRGPHRDQQFARLIREGVAVSPAGIVQDMARVAVTAVDPQARPLPVRPDAAVKPEASQKPSGRSRGMKDRPE
jgi:methylated-DNA-protein-cysteine methyltransferase related protein